jgi:hypothetical protein
MTCPRLESGEGSLQIACEYTEEAVMDSQQVVLRLGSCMRLTNHHNKRACYEMLEEPGYNV